MLSAHGLIGVCLELQMTAATKPYVALNRNFILKFITSVSTCMPSLKNIDHGRGKFSGGYEIIKWLVLRI